MPQLYSRSNGKYANGSQRYKPEPSKYLYNIDTFWYNCRSYMYGEVMNRGFRDLLIQGRSQNSDGNGSDNMTIDVKLDGYANPLKFSILGGNPPAYQYSIRNDSMAIYFRKNEQAEGSLMRVQINQFVLWEKGFINAYKESLEVLKALGFLPYETKINRIDFAVHSDQFKWTYEDMKTFDYPENIAKDNFPNFVRLDPRTGEFETYYVGDRSRLYLRIYDKSKEIKAKKKDYFNEIYKKHNMDLNNVWNVEIEVRRPYLKDLAEYADGDFKRIFDDVEYCIENDGISRLWSHLVDKYYHDSAHWTVLKAGDADKFQNINTYNLVVEKDIDANYERELNQIAGRLMMGVIDQDDYSLENAVSIFLERYYKEEKMEKSIEFLDKVENKKSKIHSYEINKTIRKNQLKETLQAKLYFEKLSEEVHAVNVDNVHETIYHNNIIDVERIKNRRSAGDEPAPK